MIFVDTGAWYALAIASDPDHNAAKSFVASINEPLVTSDYVVDELLTLFTRRGQKQRAVEWIQDVLRSGGTELFRVSDQDFESALQLFEKFHDKVWNFTDCTSFALLQRLEIKTAFSFDHHFHQFGIVNVVPTT
jgi:predicted nucleic acid-binding protein